MALSSTHSGQWPEHRLIARLSQLSQYSNYRTHNGQHNKGLMKALVPCLDRMLSKQRPTGWMAAAETAVVFPWVARLFTPAKATLGTHILPYSVIPLSETLSLQNGSLAQHETDYQLTVTHQTRTVVYYLDEYRDVLPVPPPPPPPLPCPP